MCKFASFVLTKDQVFWDDNSNSHEDIIRKHNLNESTVKVNLIRTELVPGDKWINLSSWEYTLDQDVFPDWHDPVETERRTRDALQKRFGNVQWKKIFGGVDQFIVSLKSIKWFQPDGRPLKSWKVYLKPNGDVATDAARDAAWAAARDAAWAAAWDAARDAAWDDYKKKLCEMVGIGEE